MSPKNEEQDDESTLEELNVPEFVSQIPGYLADSLDKRDQHIIETLSVMAQKQDYVLTILVLHNKVIRKVERRTNRYEKLKTVLTSKWGIIAYIFMGVAPIIMTKLVQKYWP